MNVKEKKELYIERINQFNETPLNTILSDESKNWLVWNGFFTAPASTKYHGNYEGGLFDHSLIVMNTLVQLTKDNQLQWSREESPYIVGMLHDLCKVGQYKETAEGSEYPYEYRNDTLLTGHGDKSVMVASTLLQLTEEEMYCIRYHMGAFVEKDEWNYYTRAVSKYPNVLWTHHADMIATHVCGT